MNKRLRLGLSCFILAFCSLNYEFLLAQMMAILGGHTVVFYCLTIGIYIFAIGMGALIQVEGMPEEAAAARLYRVEMLLCILGGGAPFWMIGTDALLQSLNGGWPLPFYLGIIPHGILVIAIGVLSGMELPLILRLAEIHEVKQLITRLLALDYLASFIGAISFPLVLFPRLGVVRAASLLALLNLLALVLAVPIPGRERRFYLTSALLALVLLVYIQSDRLGAWLSQAL